MAGKEYIEREAVLNHADTITVHTREYGSIDVIPVDCVSDIPAADVAPRSEVAREIFEEIEDYLRGIFDFFRQDNDIRESCAIMFALSEITKLKKKYTEAESPDMKGGE